MLTLCLAAAFQFAPSIAVPPPTFVGKTFIGVGIAAPGPDRKCTNEEAAECRSLCSDVSLITHEEQPWQWALTMRSCNVSTISGRLTMACSCENPGSRV
jgi:hypothetical protein